MLSRAIFSKRMFSISATRASHIGSAPVGIPQDVKYEISKLKDPIIKTKGRVQLHLDRTFKVTGPKGELTFDIPDFLNVSEDAGNLIFSVRDENDRQQKTFWGTSRAIINNNIVGVSEGHLAIVKLLGTGYRAAVETRDGKKYVTLKVGASHPQGEFVPEGITASSPTPTRVVLEGINKQQVKLFAAKLRAFNPPEPYKGKGIYVDDETIKLKEKRIK